jgi:hypothetical protein
MIYDLFRIIIIILIDNVTIFQMNGQTIDRRLFLMHRKFYNVPDAFWRTDITGADMIEYLINIFTDTDSGMIMTLVYVLVNVFDGLDRGADLNIDMTTISDRQKGVIGNDITFVKGMTFEVSIGFTIIWPDILGITIFTIASLGLKSFG